MSDNFIKNWLRKLKAERAGETESFKRINMHTLFHYSYVILCKNADGNKESGGSLIKLTVQQWGKRGKINTCVCVAQKYILSYLTFSRVSGCHTMNECVIKNRRGKGKLRYSLTCTDNLGATECFLCFLRLIQQVSLYSVC
jgi:hypothetical protein